MESSSSSALSSSSLFSSSGPFSARVSSSMACIEVNIVQSIEAGVCLVCSSVSPVFGTTFYNATQTRLSAAPMFCFKCISLFFIEFQKRTETLAKVGASAIKFHPHLPMDTLRGGVAPLVAPIPVIPTSTQSSVSNTGAAMTAASVPAVTPASVPAVLSQPVSKPGYTYTPPKHGATKTWKDKRRTGLYYPQTKELIYPLPKPSDPRVIQALAHPRQALVLPNNNADAILCPVPRKGAESRPVTTPIESDSKSQRVHAGDSFVATDSSLDAALEFDHVSNSWRVPVPAPRASFQPSPPATLSNPWTSLQAAAAAAGTAGI